MTPHQHTQEEAQEDINARLALIRKAVEERLASTQKGEATRQEPGALVASTCPIDPMERLLCEGCQ